MRMLKIESKPSVETHDVFYVKQRRLCFPKFSAGMRMLKIECKPSEAQHAVFYVNKDDFVLNIFSGNAHAEN
jgi:hypothetical protein